MRTLLLEFFDKRAQDLMHSLNAANLEFDTFVLRDTPDLPLDHVVNPFRYFLYGEEKQTFQPVFFNQVEVPPFAAIIGVNNATAKITSNGDVIGYIYYQQQGERIVDHVDWLVYPSSDQIVRRDFYDLAGHKYAAKFFNSNQAYLTEYYVDGRVVISEDLIAQTIELFVEDHYRHFAHLTDFFLYFLTVLNYQIEDLIINSLSFPLFISRKLALTTAASLFWQEPLANHIPENMVAELEQPSGLRQIVFQKVSQLSQVQADFPQTKLGLTYLSAIDQFVRPAQYRFRAFILTASDQLMDLDQLLKKLPELTITVAAKTEMSTKLLSLGNRYRNIILKPSISDGEIVQELDDNDIYLDINFGAKIDNILEDAYRHHLLVLGRNKVAQHGTKVIEFDHSDQLIETLHLCQQRREYWQACLQQLEQWTGPTSTIGDYQKVLAERNQRVEKS